MVQKELQHQITMLYIIYSYETTFYREKRTSNSYRFWKMIWNKKTPSASIFSLFVYSQIGKTMMFMVTLSTWNIYYIFFSSSHMIWLTSFNDLGLWKINSFGYEGTVNQCITPPKYVKLNDEYLTNVLLKINAKVMMISLTQ